MLFCFYFCLPEGLNHELCNSWCNLHIRKHYNQLEKHLLLKRTGIKQTPKAWLRNLWLKGCISTLWAPSQGGKKPFSPWPCYGMQWKVSPRGKVETLTLTAYQRLVVFNLESPSWPEYHIVEGPSPHGHPLLLGGNRARRAEFHTEPPAENKLGGCFLLAASVLGNHLPMEVKGGIFLFIFLEGLEGFYRSSGF